MPLLEQLALGAIGLAFGSRAFNTQLGLLARLGYGLVGFDMVSKALQGQGTTLAPTNGLGRTSAGPSPVKTKLHFEPREAKSIMQRVGYIHEQMLKGVRDPKVYALAREVVAQKCGDKWCIPERDARGEIAAVFGEVRKRVRYTLDPIDFDAFQTPNKTLELKAGDCDDEVALLGAMLRSIGHDVQSRIYHTRGFPTWNHIGLRVKLPDKSWMPLDPTVDKPPGWEVPRELMVQPPKDFDVVSR